VSNYNRNKIMYLGFQSDVPDTPLRECGQFEVSLEDNISYEKIIAHLDKSRRIKQIKKKNGSTQIDGYIKAPGDWLGDYLPDMFLMFKVTITIQKSDNNINITGNIEENLLFSCVDSTNLFKVFKWLFFCVVYPIILVTLIVESPGDKFLEKIAFMILYLFFGFFVWCMFRIAQSMKVDGTKKYIESVKSDIISDLRSVRSE